MKFVRRQLKFDDPNLEAEFLNDYYDRSLTTVRVALVMGIILYSAFGVLDSLITPISKYRIWLIRFGVVDPVLLIVLGLSFTGFLKKYMQLILSITALIAGLGIVVMIGITVEIQGSLFYYAGLMLVMMWAYTFVKLRFLYATICGWLIVLAYELTAIGFQDLLKSPDMIKIFINNNFFSSHPI